ncbi:hypothetical protein SeLEV6574_g06974 [Synchytrium endobioticum]|uniref:Tctex1 domain-containing protein n=2 Tax=Synchytrium endobioticum TaxID=286115 RepID=A0A507CJL0_9FUNG|nr:hypothetical protein SeLEV6574_g06974 [Synchytrium endobioticum]
MDPPSIDTAPAPAVDAGDPRPRPPSSPHRHSVSAQGQGLGPSSTTSPSRTNATTRSSSRTNLAGSHANLLGSRSNLVAVSKSNLAPATSRLGSLRNVAATDGTASAPTSASSTHAPTQAVMYENTYKMKPDKKFCSEAVKRMVDDLLSTKLAKVKYDADATPELVKGVSHDILFQVKKFEFDRYKIAVDVTIGEFKGQGIRVQSRALWDTSTDSFASSSYHNATLFAVAMVFGLYFE